MNKSQTELLACCNIVVNEAIKAHYLKAMNVALSIRAKFPFVFTDYKPETIDLPDYVNTEKGTGNADYTLPDNSHVTSKAILVKRKAFGNEYYVRKIVIVSQAQDKPRATVQGANLVSDMPVALTGQDCRIATALIVPESRNKAATAAGMQPEKRPLRQQHAALPQAIQLLRMVQHDAKLTAQIEKAREIGNTSRVENLTDQKGRNAEAIKALRSLCPELETVITEQAKSPMLFDTHKAIRMERKPMRAKRFHNMKGEH